MITQEELKELFDYRDGELYWKISKGKAIKGEICGHFDSSTGYRRVKINSKLYLVHRLIYMYNHGFIPEFIDHIDGNKLNNRLENTRPATKSQNNMNRGAQSNNTTGFKGVTFHKRLGKFQGQIKFNNKMYHLGYFCTAKEASDAYERKAQEFFGDYYKTKDPTEAES